MTKETVIVPSNIRYMNEWEDFYNNFPRFPHILDKQVPGCGFTEWCLTNPDNVILCSPRNMLILNKTEQHLGEVYRVRNDKYDVDPGVDKDLSGEDKKQDQDEEERSEITPEEKIAFTTKLKQELEIYFSERDAIGAPYKILVTYDSFRILKDILEEISSIHAFQIVVDEFQTIFTDSRFKSNTELEFVEVLQDIKKVCYLSATPMIDKYLEMLPEFKDLPYIELDWTSENPARLCRPELDVKIIDSIYKPIKKIVKDYKDGNFESCIITDETGQLRKIYSQEAMIYVNSVNNIIQIIKKCDLKPEEVNILCSGTPENLKRIQKALGKQWIIGKVPLKHEPRKMFTFCTRTVYLGADFYSDNARTFVLSDANLDCLAVDISLDLPQILGRQRNNKNPWKNCAEFYYKPFMNYGKRVKLTPEEFDMKINEKVKETQDLLNAYVDARPEAKSALTKNFEFIAAKGNYKENYIAVNKHAGSEIKPVLNNLVMVAEKRAFEIQQIDYKDRFSVISTIDEVFNEDQEKLKIIVDTCKKIESIVGIKDKLKFFIELDLDNSTKELIKNNLDHKMRSYLELGEDSLKAVGYNVTRMDNVANSSLLENKASLTDKILETFKVGDRLGMGEVKQIISKIYSELKIKKKPVGSDISEWFEIKTINVSRDGKRVKGYELIRKL